jgi:hypothetical protein
MYADGVIGETLGHSTYIHWVLVKQAALRISREKFVRLCFSSGSEASQTLLTSTDISFGLTNTEIEYTEKYLLK